VAVVWWHCPFTIGGTVTGLTAPANFKTRGDDLQIGERLFTFKTAIVRNKPT